MDEIERVINGPQPTLTGSRKYLHQEIARYRKYLEENNMHIRKLTDEQWWRLIWAMSPSTLLKHLRAHEQANTSTEEGGSQREDIYGPEIQKRRRMVVR